MKSVEIGIIGVFALALFFVIPQIALRRDAKVSPGLPLIVALVHLISCFGAILFVQARPLDTDTLTYFYDLTYSLGSAIKPGTSFITHLTWWLRSGLGAEFDDLMAIYALSGIIAYALMIRLLVDYHRDVPPSWLATVMLLLPANHFYSSAIGKDGLCMLGVAAVVLGMARFPSRIVLTGLGLLILVLTRPHIAGITVIAVGFVLMFSASSRAARVFAIVMLLAAPFAGFFIFRTFLDINIFDLDQVTTMLADRDQALSSSTFTINYIQNPALRVLSFLLSPFFFDAANALALLASFENLVLFLVLCIIVRNFVRYKLYRDGYPRILMVYAICIALFLGLTNYNIGLGLRLKAMLFPILFGMLVVAQSVRHRRAA